MTMAKLVELGVQQGSFPRTLYKYRHFDEHTKSIFENRQLWFAHLESFNDPFDCQIHDLGSYTTEDLMHYLTQDGMSSVEASSFVLLEAKNPGFIESTLRESKKTTLAKLGISRL